MPQVDLSSVCAGAGGIAPDRKVACETTATSSASDTDESPPPPPPPPIDYAPESFFLSKDAEREWLDQNAYIERKNSGKGPTSTTSNSNSNSNPNSIYVSQRHLKSKASILGLPKPQKPNYTEAKNRRPIRPASIRLFPKRSESIGRKPAAALSEPSSPKVSCMGRVRSRRDRKKQAEPNRGSVATKSVKTTKTGFWNNLLSMFQSKGDKIGCKGIEPDGEPVVPRPRRCSNSRRKCGGSSSESTPGEPPGLGAMNRFASGRRSDAWAGEIEVKSEPLDRSPIWRRREKGPPAHVGVDRDWQSVGPASV